MPLTLQFSWIRRNRSGRPDPSLQRIQALREALVQVGYNPGEVDHMIWSLAGHREIVKLDPESLNKVETALDKQLSLARKCLYSVQNGRQS